MSLIRKQRELEGASDAYLQQLLQQGSPEYPGWLVATVANGRAFDRQLKANAMAMARAEEPTITDQVATKLDEAGVPSVDPNQMGDPRLATGIASGVAVAGGGMIPEYQNGGLMGDDDDDPEEETAARRRRRLLSRYRRLFDPGLDIYGSPPRSIRRPLPPRLSFEDPSSFYADSVNLNRDVADGDPSLQQFSDEAIRVRQGLRRQPEPEGVDFADYTPVGRSSAYRPMLEGSAEALANVVAQEFLERGERASPFSGAGINARLGRLPRPEQLGDDLSDDVRFRALQIINEAYEAKADRGAFEEQLAVSRPEQSGRLYQSQAEGPFASGDNLEALQELGYRRRAPAFFGTRGQISLRLASEHPEVFDAILADNPGGLDTVDWAALDNPESLAKLQSLIPETVDAAVQQDVAETTLPEESPVGADTPLLEEGPVGAEGTRPQQTTGGTEIPSAREQMMADARLLGGSGLTVEGLYRGRLADIEDFAKAREPNEDDRALYRRLRKDLNLGLSQARRVAKERGKNAEERQEIYDNLRADLKAQAAQRAATLARRRDVRGIRARGIGLGSLGTAEGRGRMSQFTEDIFAEDIAAENREREAILGDSERLLSDLTSLQNYEEATGTSLDQAVLEHSKGQRDLLKEVLDTDETRLKEAFDLRADLFGDVIGAVGTLEANRERMAQSMLEAALSGEADQVDPFDLGDYETATQIFLDSVRQIEEMEFHPVTGQRLTEEQRNEAIDNLNKARAEWSLSLVRGLTGNVISEQALANAAAQRDAP